ncbi:MAG: hypothetical protein ACETVR_03010 [Candidatus Bathyarchaeia archaeon]
MVRHNPGWGLSEELSPEEILERSWYLRRFGKEWIKRYPSIKKMALSVVNRRKRGSPATVNGYIQGVRRFIDYLDIGDPE